MQLVSVVWKFKVLLNVEAPSLEFLKWMASSLPVVENQRDWKQVRPFNGLIFKMVSRGLMSNLGRFPENRMDQSVTKNCSPVKTQVNEIAHEEQFYASYIGLQFNCEFINPCVMQSILILVDECLPCRPFQKRDHFNFWLLKRRLLVKPIRRNNR